MEPTLSKPTWKRRLGLILANVLAIAVTIPACFMVFIMGAFASDSGTREALIISFSLIGFAGLYALVTLVFVILSQVRNSFKLALLPAILPILFYIWVSIV